MNILPTQVGTIKMVALVRDSQGNVKYDNPHKVPEAILAALNEADLAHLAQLKLDTPRL